MGFNQFNDGSIFEVIKCNNEKYELLNSESNLTLFSCEIKDERIKNAYNKNKIIILNDINFSTNDGLFINYFSNLVLDGHYLAITNDDGALGNFYITDNENKMFFNYELV